VRLASLSRRSGGLLAVAALGVTGALVGMPTPAQAASSGWSFSTDDGTDPMKTVPAGTCAVDWTLIGANSGTERRVTTTVRAGDILWLVPGQPGSGVDTRVTKDFAVFLSAAGIGADGGTVVDGGAAQIIANPGRDWVGSTARTAPTGLVSGEGVACEGPAVEAPGAPQRIQTSTGPGAGQFWLLFDPAPTGPQIFPVTGYEYSLDGGPWRSDGAVAAAQAPFTGKTLTVSGLNPGQAYSARVRATSAGGPSPASAAITSTAATSSLAAPTGVTAETGPSSLTVHWSAPSNAGSIAVGGYSVRLFAAGEATSVEGCRTTAAARSCLVPVRAGTTYAVFVAAFEPGGALGQSGSVQSGTVPAPAIPASVPPKDDDLTGASGAAIERVTAGRTVVLKGSGYAPFSTVRAIAYSTPQELGTFVTDANGEFEVTVSIPAGLPVGEHSLVVTGLDPTGVVRNLRVDVTVAAGGTPSITRATLAYTGADVAVPLTGGLVSVAVGGGLILAGRRRADATGARTAATGGGPVS
jgi:hypothetical protein